MSDYTPAPKLKPVGVQDAYAMAIDALREGPNGEEKRTKDAIKILTKKHEKLRLQRETKAAQIKGLLEKCEDKYAEMPSARILEVRVHYHGRVCEACLKAKQPAVAFCALRCWPTLSPGLRKCLHSMSIGDGWEGAYELALEELKEKGKPCPF